jgi:cysteine desulfurase/selenocysteine lyase
MYKQDFPLFSSHPEVLFLDSASSAQKPQYVIDALSRYFANSYSNIHRGAYDLSMESSQLYDRAKKSIADALSARADEVVFTYNATYAFNLIARGCIKS